MYSLKIVEWPAKVLETKASPVEKFDADLRHFVQAMHATMERSNGIGLAANQVGDLRRVLTIHIPWRDDDGNEDSNDVKEWWHDTPFTIINPTVTRVEHKTRYLEGCLSFPEMYDYVQRAAEIWIQYFDEHGVQKDLHATGLFAICLQHEIDHLDGIVFIDRMSRLKASGIRKKMLQRPSVKSMENELVDV